MVRTQIEFGTGNDNRGVADTIKSGPFLYRKYERGIKEFNVSSSCYQYRT